MKVHEDSNNKFKHSKQKHPIQNKKKKKKSMLFTKNYFCIKNLIILLTEILY